MKKNLQALVDIRLDVAACYFPISVHSTGAPPINANELNLSVVAEPQCARWHPFSSTRIQVKGGVRKLIGTSRRTSTPFVIGVRRSPATRPTSSNRECACVRNHGSTQRRFGPTSLDTHPTRRATPRLLSPNGNGMNHNTSLDPFSVILLRVRVSWQLKDSNTVRNMKKTTGAVVSCLLLCPLARSMQHMTCTT